MPNVQKIINTKEFFEFFFHSTLPSHHRLLIVIQSFLQSTSADSSASTSKTNIGEAIMLVVTNHFSSSSPSSIARALFFCSQTPKSNTKMSNFSLTRNVHRPHLPMSSESSCPSSPCSDARHHFVLTLVITPLSCSCLPMKTFYRDEKGHFRGVFEDTSRYSRLYNLTDTYRQGERNINCRLVLRCQ